MFHLKLGSIENLKAVRLHRAKIALADLAKNAYDWESVLDMDMDTVDVDMEKVIFGWPCQ